MAYYGQQQQQQHAQGQPDLLGWFQAVDQDRSGRITAPELREALINGNNSTFSLEACNMLISLFDADRTMSIEFQEFQHLFGFINQWKAAYEMYDADKSGAIDGRELEQAFSQMGYRFSPQIIQTILKKYDTPARRGQVNLDNFIVVCVQLQKLTGAFRVRDKESKGQIFIGYEDFLQAVLDSL